MAAVQAHMETLLTAKKDGGQCCLCAAPVQNGDKLWPVEGKSSHKHRYAHRSCAATQAGCLPHELSPPVCKHWVKRGSCAFQDTCFFRHPMEAKGTECKQHVGRTKGGSRKRRSVANDSRAFLLRAFLIDTFGLDCLRQGSGVLDVGGGNGELGFQIVNLNKIPTTIIDPRPLRLRRYARKLAFGMYTKNIAWARYNHPSFPLGCTVRPSEMVTPRHLRILFQIDPEGTGRKRMTSSWCETPQSSTSRAGARCKSSSTSDSSPLPAHALDALESESSYVTAVTHAKATAWTRKGLVHEEDVGGNDNCGAVSDGSGGGSNIGPEDVELHEESDGEHEQTIRFNRDVDTAPRERAPLSANAASEEDQVGSDPSLGCELLPLSPELDYASADSVVRDCSLVVGLHPDQAASEIVRFATIWKKPFAVVPCCVYKQQFPYRTIPALPQAGSEPSSTGNGASTTKQASGEVSDKIPNSSRRAVSTYDDLVEWCVLNGPPGTRVADLDFEGKNKVVYWKGDDC